MDIYEKLSNLCIKFISKNLKKSEDELKEVNYGIQVFLINTIKLAILFLLASILGILKYTFIAVISFAFIRIFASGVHAKSNLRCTITNIILFIGNVYLSMNIVLEKPVKTVIFIISLSLITIYAPSDTEERPLVSKRLRKKLKVCSIACSIVLTLSAGFITLQYKSQIISNLIIFSLLEESVLITPMAYYIFDKKYSNYEKRLHKNLL